MKAEKGLLNLYVYIIAVIFFFAGILFWDHIIDGLKSYSHFRLVYIDNMITKEINSDANFIQKLNAKIVLQGSSYQKDVLKCNSFRISGIISNFNTYYQIQKKHIHIARLKAG